MTDAVVIGGGIVGAATAYRLARAGTAVTVVDRSDDGHATAAGAGIIPCLPGTATTVLDQYLRDACVYYRELIPALAEDGETDTGYETVGGLRLATDDAERSLLRDELATFAGAPGVERIDAADAKRLFPALRDDVEVLRLADISRVDGRRLRASLLRAVAHRSGTVIRGDADIVIEDGRATGVQVDGERIAADAIVAATGAWTDALGSTFGVYPQRGQILHLALPTTDTSDWPVLTGYRGHYLLTFPQNRVVAGATREDDAGFDYRTTTSGQAQLIADALHYAPGLADATIVETRVGFRPRSRDGLPTLGPVPGIDGLLIANGLGEFGLTGGPYAGALIADFLLDASTAGRLAQFGPSRWTEMRL